jgi:hypothetical protein
MWNMRIVEIGGKAMSISGIHLKIVGGNAANRTVTKDPPHPEFIS